MPNLQTTITDSLFRVPCPFQLGQAIYWLSRMKPQEDDPLASGDFDRAVIRLRNRKDEWLRPPVSDVDAITPREGGVGWDVFTGALNLVGTTGALPYELQAALLLQDDRVKWRGRIDRLVHRMLSRWYNTWILEKHFEELEWLWPSPPWKVADVPLLGLLPTSREWHPAYRSASGLALLVESHYGAQTSIIPCQGEWSKTPDGLKVQYTRQFRATLILGSDEHPVDDDVAARLLTEDGRQRLLGLLAEILDVDIQWTVDAVFRTMVLKGVCWNDNKAVLNRDAFFHQESVLNDTTMVRLVG